MSDAYGKMTQHLSVEPIPGDFTVSKVSDLSLIKLDAPFTFIGSTDSEKSLVCPTPSVPSDTVEREDGWRMFRVRGTLDFSLIGILSDISSRLAEKNISVFALSTFDTDYIMTKKERFEEALSVLSDAGYDV